MDSCLVATPSRSVNSQLQSILPVWILSKFFSNFCLFVYLRPQSCIYLIKLLLFISKVSVCQNTLWMLKVLEIFIFYFRFWLPGYPSSSLQTARNVVSQFPGEKMPTDPLHTHSSVPPTTLPPHPIKNPGWGWRHMPLKLRKKSFFRAARKLLPIGNACFR